MEAYVALSTCFSRSCVAKPTFSPVPTKIWTNRERSQKSLSMNDFRFLSLFESFFNNSSITQKSRSQKQTARKTTKLDNRRNWKSSENGNENGSRKKQRRRESSKLLTSRRRRSRNRRKTRPSRTRLPEMEANFRNWRKTSQIATKRKTKKTKIYWSRTPETEPIWRTTNGRRLCKRFAWEIKLSAIGYRCFSGAFDASQGFFVSQLKIFIGLQIFYKI